MFYKLGSYLGSNVDEAIKTISSSFIFFERKLYTHKNAKITKSTKNTKSPEVNKRLFPHRCVFKRTEMLPFLSLSACMHFVPVKFFR